MTPQRADESSENQLSIRSLIELLKAEHTLEKQKLIIIFISREVEESIDIELTVNKLFEKGLIQKDLKANQYHYFRIFKEKGKM